MDIITFKKYIENCLNSLPNEIKNLNNSLDVRKLDALIHLNTEIRPDLKNNVGTLLEILNMKDSFEKLRLVMLWDIAVSSSTSTHSMHKIIELMDNYIKESVS
jgi:hypothetical protein